VAPPARGFIAALGGALAAGCYGAFIAEIKARLAEAAASSAPTSIPSRWPRPMPAGGATLPLVLTDAPHFQGRAEYLAAARDACALRAAQGFHARPLQIVESRASAPIACLADHGGAERCRGAELGERGTGSA